MPDLAILLNARLPGRTGRYCLEIRQHQIKSIMPMERVMSNAIQAVDLDGDWVSLGGMDLQINGALGLAFPDLTSTALPSLAKVSSFLRDQGISAYLPTLVTTSAAALQTSLETLRQYQQSVCPAEPVAATRPLSAEMPPLELPRADILGVHLEGPFLNPAKRGAHPEVHLQPLILDQVQALLKDFIDLIKVVTLAPELDPSGAVVSWLKAQGIVVSLGHSLATATEAQQAFDAGASMVTHACNAMPGLHHREPGLLGAALTRHGVSCGLIADGQHVSKTMLDLLLRAWRGQLETANGHGSGLFLVSDALAPLGLPDGTYPWDEREIEVTGGTARLPDGTLAGTTRPLLDGATNLVAWHLARPDEAICLATEAPRQALNLPGLAVGQPADLLRWRYRDGHLSWSWLELVNARTCQR
ncbi:MAG: N-acetylglucosamine-6-phosphate deacetylase [Cyanobacteria bacterium J06632_22]